MTVLITAAVCVFCSDA